MYVLARRHVVCSAVGGATFCRIEALGSRSAEVNQSFRRYEVGEVVPYVLVLEGASADVPIGWQPKVIL